MTESAPKPATSLAPAPLGNRRAATHGAYISKLSASENVELAEIADEIRGVVPIDSPSIEAGVVTLAGLVWRQRKLYAYLDQHGITRGRSDRATLNPALEALLQIDKQILAAMAALSMLPKQAADLGLSLVKLESKRRFDRSRLTPAEQVELDRLLNKSATYDGEPDDA